MRKCLEENCNYETTEEKYFYGPSFVNHLWKRHNISRRQYAEKHKTEEWIPCVVCGKFIAKGLIYQKFDKYGNNINTCCNKCKTILRIERGKLNGKLKKAAKQAAKTRKENGYYESDSYKASNELRVQKMLEAGTYTLIAQKSNKKKAETGSAKTGAQKGHKTKLEKGIYKTATQNRTITMITNGTNIIRAQKANKTIEEKGIRKDMMRKARETRIKNKTTERMRNDGTFTRAMIKYEETMLRKYGRRYNIQPNYSEMSQELFREIEVIIFQFQKNLKCFYATNGETFRSNEYVVTIRQKACSVRYLDFYIPEIKTCIEFDEKKHENPKRKRYDKIREKQIIKAIPDIRIIRIKERDFKQNKQKTIIEAINFILELKSVN